MPKKLKKKINDLLPPASPPPADDDEELMDTLLAQLDSRDKTVQAESATVIQQIAATKEESARDRQDAKSRFHARQARKAAAKAANYTQDDPAAEAKLKAAAAAEEKAIHKICKNLGLQIYEVNPDGHCLFSAIADQLSLLSIVPVIHANYTSIRTAAADYIYSHSDDFLPFLSPEDGSDGIMTPQQFASYCTAMRNTAEWGGEPEILALSRAFNVPIHVIQGSEPPVVIHKPTGAPNYDVDLQDRAVRISYHRHMYGLGEHYNSLRPISRPPS